MPSDSDANPIPELSEHTLFTKQRDILIQEIALLLQSVNENLARLNRQLNDSVQVGKSFEDVGKTWSTFYDKSDVSHQNNSKSDEKA